MSSTRNSKLETRNFKRLALVVLGLLLVSQAPFACRRYRLGRLRAAVEGLNARRLPAPPEDPFEDYAGVFHVHSSLGGHSEGRPEEIVSAAASNGLAFVVMTEHPAAGVNTAEATLRGPHGGVLFVGGSELVARGGERLFVVPGFAQPPAADSLPLPELIARAKAEGRLALLAYPEQLGEWPAGGYDGIEVYNLYTNAREINYVRLFFDGLWSYAAHPDLLFATFYERPGGNLKRWDEVNAAGAARASAVAGNDAHANVGFDLAWPGGGKLFGVRLDPYERSFRVVRNHVLLRRGEPLSAEALLEALRAGRSYIAFDLFGEAAGFRFQAENARGRKTMGEEISLADGTVRLRARAPVECRLLFFRDGEVFAEAGGPSEKELIIERPGVYRVEAYLDQLGSFLHGKPWIISNPIYVRQGAVASSQ
ncbi:MAG TPA: hypothetical protein VG148_03000 [Pyrinomonadaceae bacterium]|nr:hypothetical protein [Pyrinomonadaceae bacterium]